MNKVIPFRFPSPDEKPAGLCQTCLDAPVRVVPCGHTDIAGAPPPVTDPAEGHEADPADHEPTEKQECRVCGSWRAEHTEADEHRFQPHGRTTVKR